MSLRWERVQWAHMISHGFAYVPGNTLLHRSDARVKIVALLAFSIGVFFVSSWWGMLACVLLVVVFAVWARVPAGALNRMLVPVYVLAGFSVLFNVVAAPGWEGLVRGLFFGVRMVVLVAASFVVCMTTTATQLLDGFSAFMAPLRVLRVPVDDIALTLSLSIRFIPVVEEEFRRIRSAQLARGAESAGSVRQRLSSWGIAFASLFVGLFRHADVLAQAMDARCYGASPVRSRLPK